MNNFLQALAEDEFFRRFIPENTLAKLAMQRYQQYGMPPGIRSDLGVVNHRDFPTTLDDPTGSGQSMRKLFNNQPNMYLDNLRYQPPIQTKDREPFDPMFRRKFNWM